MKASIPSSRSLVLFYHLAPLKQKALCKVLDSLHLPYREILPSQLQQTLGALASGADVSGMEYQNSPPDCECMVMCGFSRNQVNQLLEQMRKAGVPKISLKAVLTAQNQHWPVLDLLRELEQEHEIMEVYTRLHLALQEAESIGEENQDPVLWNALNQAIFSAKQALASEEPSAKALSNALETLLDARKALR